MTSKKKSAPKTGLSAITRIQNKDDVKDFFKALNRKLGLSWHPDTRFGQYEIFEKAEASRLDKLMTAAFAVCKKAKLDIYELAWDMSYNMRRKHGIGIQKKGK